MGLKVIGEGKTGSFECQTTELQKYPLNILISFIYDKLKNDPAIQLSGIQIFLLQQIVFDQMHRITQQ